MIGISIDKDERLSRAVRLMVNGGYRVIYCVNQNRVDGILSEGDIIRFWLLNKISDPKISELMKIEFTYFTEVQAKSNPSECTMTLMKKKLVAGPVLNTGRELVGEISLV